MVIPDRIDYRALAAHISGISLYATSQDLAVRLMLFPGAIRLAEAVFHGTNYGASWFDGLTVVSAVLHAENPRFDRGLFEEWCVETK